MQDDAGMLERMPVGTPSVNNFGKSLSMSEVARVKARQMSSKKGW